MAAIDDLLRNTAAMAKQRDAAFTAAAAQTAGATKALLMALPIGTRVVDLVTGLEGVIVDGHRENVVIPLANQPGS
jgi:hypothetical protein